MPSEVSSALVHNTLDSGELVGLQQVLQLACTPKAAAVVDARNSTFGMGRQLSYLMDEEILTAALHGNGINVQSCKALRSQQQESVPTNLGRDEAEACELKRYVRSQSELKICRHYGSGRAAHPSWS